MPYITSIERRGIEQGRAKGAASLLRQLLAQRFEEVPAWAAEKLEHASQEDLERWGARILDAEVIEDVFSPQ